MKAARTNFPATTILYRVCLFTLTPKSIHNKRGRDQVKLHKTVFWVLEGGKGHFARLKTETSDSETGVHRTDRQTELERTNVWVSLKRVIHQVTESYSLIWPKMTK